VRKRWFYAWPVRSFRKQVRQGVHRHRARVMRRLERYTKGEIRRNSIYGGTLRRGRRYLLDTGVTVGLDIGMSPKRYLWMRRMNVGATAGVFLHRRSRSRQPRHRFIRATIDTASGLPRYSRQQSRSVQ